MELLGYCIRCTGDYTFSCFLIIFSVLQALQWNVEWSLYLSLFPGNIFLFLLFHHTFLTIVGKLLSPRKTSVVVLCFISVLGNWPFNSFMGATWDWQAYNICKESKFYTFPTQSSCLWLIFAIYSLSVWILSIISTISTSYYRLGPANVFYVTIHVHLLKSDNTDG